EGLGRGLGAGLVELNLHATELGPEALEALARGPFERLARLSLSGQPGHRQSPAAAMRSLAALRTLTHVDAKRFVDADAYAWLLETDLPERLELVGELSAAGDWTYVLATVFARPWPRLRTLYLHGGGQALAGASLPALESFRGCRIGAEGARALCDADTPALTTVHLPQGMVGVRLGDLLRELAGLRQLTLSTDNLDADAIGDLQGAAAPKTLTHLGLSQAKLTDDALARLLTAEWPALEHLVLRGNALSAEAASLIAAASFAKQLHNLDLQGAALDVDALRALAQGPFAELRALSLRNTPIDAAAITLLAESETLPQLAYLNLRDTSVSSEGIAALAASALPALEEIEVGDLAAEKKAAIPAPPGRIVSQTRLARADDGTSRAAARYYG
ncbi:MAG: hypothetical protein KC731_15650, partial [Myxococcales bacterium]|nr:hypothetical protein [Myxococcales bacterium]